MHFDQNEYISLRRFLLQMRRLKVKEEAVFNERLKNLLLSLEHDQAFKKEFSSLVELIMNKAQFVNAFTDYGINSNRGFFPELYGRVKHKLIPPKLDENELSNFINFLFPKKSDLHRLSIINNDNWELIIALLDEKQFLQYEYKFMLQLHNAIIILSHRLTSIGIDPYVVKRLPRADDTDSPFFQLNEQVSHIAKTTIKPGSSISDDETEAAHRQLTHCENLLHELEEQKDKTGISLHLTFLIKLAYQQIARIRILMTLFLSKEKEKKIRVISKIIAELAIAEKEKNSVRKFFNQNTQLLAYRIISHTSEKGEHYIGFSKAENKKLFNSAMGGGFVVILLVFIKHNIHKLHLSPFPEGVLFGLNYAAGFVFMHLAHLTLATKQPAMTASYMAASLQGENIDVSKAARAFRQVMRSQFISLFGNLVVVLPICFLLAYVLSNIFNYHVFSYSESYKYLKANHPLLSASLFFAFITGIFLSLSGYITGYIDNKMIFSEIPFRIRNHPSLKDKMKTDKLMRLSIFLEKNAGAIIGNIFLGLCLGLAGNIGEFIGLPFDIRHVTISAGYFGIAAGSSTFLSVSFVLTVFAGVIAIGLINIFSSFLISFALACRSRNLSFKQSLKLLAGIGK